MRETLRIIRLPALALALAGLVYLVASWDRPVERVGEQILGAAVALQGVARSADSDILREVAETGGYERVWVVDGSGVVVASSHALEAGRKVESPWLELLMNAGGRSVLEGRDWGSRHLYVAAHRSAQTGRWSVILQDGRSVTDGRRRLVLSTLASISGILLLLSAATHLALGKNLLEPLARLEAASESTLRGDSSELGRLADDSPTGRIATVLAEKANEGDRLAGELKEQRALYFSVLNLAREMVLVASFDGTVLEVNRSFCERLGIDRNAALGHALHALGKHVPAEALLQLGERSAKEQRVFDRLILSFTSKEGEVMHVVAAVQAVPFRGKPALMVVADDRTNEQSLAVRVSELLRQQTAPAMSATESTGDEGGAESP